MLAATAMPIKATMFLGSLGILAQIAPVPAGSLESIGRITLDGALVIAVGVLWRAIGTITAQKDTQIAAKDAQIMMMSTKVTETMTLVLESVKEARKASEDIGAALDIHSSNIAALPCAMDPSFVMSAEKKDWARRHGKSAG